MRVCLRCETRFGNETWRCPSCRYGPREGEFLIFAEDERGEAFSETSFRDVTEVERGSFWFRHRGRLISWAVGHYFPGARDLLEVGCGTGSMLASVRAAFPRLSLSGSDLASAGLAAARQRLPGVPLYAFDAMRIPFWEEFDVIGAFDVIEHVDDDVAVLSRIRAALRPRGGLLLTVPQHAWLWSPVDDYSGHRRRYTREGLRQKIERAGFHRVRITSFVALLLPLLAISRALQRGRPVDPYREHRAAARLDRLLEHVQAIERGMIRMGVSFPAGGSLLVVARRDG